MVDIAKHSTAFDIEFNDPSDAQRVYTEMKRGMRFQEAVDHLGFRQNVHYIVVRTDAGEDGRA